MSQHLKSHCDQNSNEFYNYKDLNMLILYFDLFYLSTGICTCKMVSVSGYLKREVGQTEEYCPVNQSSHE